MRHLQSSVKVLLCKCLTHPLLQSFTHSLTPTQPGKAGRSLDVPVRPAGDEDDEYEDDADGDDDADDADDDDDDDDLK